MKRTIIFAWLLFSINLRGMQGMRMGGRQEGRPQSLYGTLTQQPSRPGAVSPVEFAKLTEKPAEQKPTGAVQTVTILRVRKTKDATIKELEKLRKLDLDIGIGGLNSVQLASKENSEYWLALAFLQRAASAYARLEAFKNEFSDQEKKAFEDIANFGYWFENTEKVTQASFWQALANAIFYIKHPRNQEWKNFLEANNIKILEDLSNKLSSIKTTFDNQLDRYKIFATVLASAAANNLYPFIERFLQALLILRIGDKSSEQDLIKARTIFETLLTEVAKNKSLEAELEKAKIALREIANFRNNLDQKTIVQDLQRNKEEIDKLLPKEVVKGTRTLEERRAQPGIIPVPVPVPIRGKKEQEQPVAGIERPQPTQPIIEQPMPITVEPAVALQPQPEPTIVAPPVSVAPIEVPAPAVPVSVRPEELPAPSLEIVPREGGEGQTKILSNQELADRWRTYNREMRTKKTAAQMKELVERLENEKQLIETQPGILERAKDQLLQLQEEEKEQQRLQGMQLVPYVARPDIAKPTMEEPKTPRYTLAPGAEHLLEEKKEEQRMPVWQQKMIEEQQRQFTEQLNEQLRQQLLEELQQEQVLQPSPAAPVTVIPAPVPVAPLVQPIARPTVTPTPSVPKPARPVTPPVQLPAPTPVQVPVPVEEPVQLAQPIVRPTISPAPVAEQPKPIFPRAEQVAQAFAPRPTTPAPVLVKVPEPELEEIPVTPPVPRPSLFVAAPELSRLSGPISATAQTGVIPPTPVAPIQPAMQVQPTPLPVVPTQPIAPTVSVPPSITPIEEKKPTVSLAQENIIAVIGKELQRFKDMPLPSIRANSKDKDTQQLAELFLQQALEAFELYHRYQPQMRRQEVLVELRDWVIFFNQLEQAYIRARESYDNTIAAAYFEALKIAIAGKISGWVYSTSILTKEQAPLFEELKKQFAKNIAETEVLLRIAQGAAQQGPLVLKSVWEFITSLIVVIKDDENYPQERKAASEALLRLLPLVDSTSANYNEDIENALHTARKALLSGFKSSQSDTYPFYLSIIHTSGDESRVYDDIRRALNKLNIPPPTRIEQEKRELTNLIKKQDPRAITKLQEIEQLPADVKQEMKEALRNIQPAAQEQLANIYMDVIGKEAQLGNIAQAQALVQQAGNILPAQQPAILAQVQPIIATAQRKEAEVISAQTAQIIPSLQPVQPAIMQSPVPAQATVIQLQAPVQPPQPITPEELAFLVELNKQLEISNEIIIRVLDIFSRAMILKDNNTLRLYGPLLGRMVERIEKMRQLQQPELESLDASLISKLRTLWKNISAQIGVFLQIAERAKVKDDRLKKIAQFEQQIAKRTTIDQLRAMVPELNMMMILGPQEVTDRAEQLLNEVEDQLTARTRWLKPVLQSNT